MVFNSVAFAVFLPLVFSLYWFVFSRTVKWQNVFLIVAGYVFYGWWDIRFLTLLAFSSGVDFIVAIYIQKTENIRKRKLLLGISLITNLGLLGFFKYYDFFVQSFVSAFATFGYQLNASVLHIILPVGISFYTFQSLSYTIDVYRKKIPATKNAFAFFAFVSFFPQLVAGPIERATHILPRYFEKRKFNDAFAFSGMRLMLWGFFKKIVIADNLSKYVDAVFNNPDNYHGATVIVATVFFAIQIYCDFSGYSDIAIGVARLFGFELMKNFNAPYFSASPKEFWYRWHISLSSWFRDYVYFPLGGSKKGEGRTYINLLLTFFISGLWHGASWTYVIWGTYHGIAVSLQHFFEKHIKIRLPQIKPLAVLLTFIFVCFGWIFFRAASFNNASTLIANIFTNANAQEWKNLFPSAAMGSEMLQSLILFLILEITVNTRYCKINFAKSKPWLRWSIYYFLVVWILFFGAFKNAPQFIYFQF